ncbi:MAG TPA: NYN domain-containing protein [Candidatus Udaeobacter sp.]|nr:NYN domain-containing protein [Candidatus Udaeobacter sp.]
MARHNPSPGANELILVDGYNLIFRHPELRILARTDLERARAELVRRIAGAALTGGQVVVVFDGREAGVSAGRPRGATKVRVVFSAPNQTADQRIQQLLESARAAPGGAAAMANYRVVSSDREVIGRAQLWGARVTSGEAFLAELSGGSAPKAKRPRPAPLGDQEIAEWEQIFRRRPRGDDEGKG